MNDTFISEYANRRRFLEDFYDVTSMDDTIKYININLHNKMISKRTIKRLLDYSFYVHKLTNNIDELVKLIEYLKEPNTTKHTKQEILNIILNEPKINSISKFLL